MATKTVNVLARDEMKAAAFDEMMRLGLTEAKADHSRPVAEVFSELKQEI